MADVKVLAEELVNLTVKEVNELATILKEEYGIEPAAAAVAVAAPAAGAGEAAVAEKATEVAAETCDCTEACTCTEVKAQVTLLVLVFTQVFDNLVCRAECKAKLRTYCEEGHSHLAYEGKCKVVTQIDGNLDAVLVDLLTCHLGACT